MKIRDALILGLAILAVKIPAASLPPPSAESLNGEFQFSAGFDNDGLDGNPAHGFTAYLWIPPSAARVRAVIVTQQNVGEQPFTEDPAIRAVCARHGIAILWSCPAIDLRFENKRGQYQIDLNRGWPETPNFIAVRHAGDERHRPSVQPGRFVPPVYTGRAQRIDFPPVGDQSVGGGAVRLRATSSAGLKVRYFVRSGPATMVDDRLVLLPLPPRTKLPVPVTVVAWQIGTKAGGGVAPANPVEQTIQVGATANAR